jgi:hypothetical protein
MPSWENAINEMASWQNGKLTKWLFDTMAS